MPRLLGATATGDRPDDLDFAVADADVLVIEVDRRADVAGDDLDAVTGSEAAGGAVLRDQRRVLLGEALEGDALRVALQGGCAVVGADGLPPRVDDDPF